MDRPRIWKELFLEVEELEDEELYRVRIPLEAKVPTGAYDADKNPVIRRIPITPQVKKDICEGFVRVRTELVPLRAEPTQKFYHLRRLPTPPPKKGSP